MTKLTAQARDRLGFVFPGEQAIRVEHPEAVTGETTEDAKKTDESQKTVLPWYKEMAYSFKQADQSDEVKSKSRETSESTSTGESDANGTSQESGGQQQTSQDNNQQQSGDQQE